MKRKTRRSSPKATKRAATMKKTVSIVARTKRGRVLVRVPADATPQDRVEAVHFVRTLDANQQIAHGKSLTPGTTHQVTTDAKGKKILVRKRFSAI